jgi:Fuc2NAc and GlcNAc transferase
MNFILIISAILAILSFTLTYFIRLWALRYKVLDIPNERSSHSSPTPRGGGLAIVVCWYLGISFLYFNGILETSLFYAFLSGAVLAVFSLIDDLLSLSPWIRIIAQLLSALLAVYFLQGVDHLTLFRLDITNELILLPLAVIAIVWFINVYNFLDGIDGYASIEAICLSAILFIFTGNTLNLVLIVSVAGFLSWNWPKARIFMGDVGSTQIGFILAVLAIHYNNNGHFELVHWIILSSPFWFDATLTLLRRWMNRENLGRAHKKHAYQRIVQHGWSHLQTDLALVAINLLLFAAIFLVRDTAVLTIPILVLVIAFLSILTRLVDRKVPFR